VFEEAVVTVLIFIFVALLVLASVVYFLLVPILRGDYKPLGEMGPSTRSEDAVTIDYVEEQYAPNMQALPFDPANPPVARTWPGSGGIIPVRHCMCHGKEVVKGQKVLLWPVFEDGVQIDTKVVCRKEGM
jgi:hypothetical protein